MKAINCFTTFAVMAAAVAIFADSGPLHIEVHAQAKNLPAACMKSFEVKDKTFSSGNATMSCRLTEIRRGELFSAIDAMDESGEIDGDTLSKKLMAIEATLKKQEEETNWVGIGKEINGNALATIGLSACLTGKAGCALAVIGKVMSLVDVLDAVQSEAEKKKVAAQLRAEISKVRTEEVAGKKNKTKVVRDRLVADFERLCEDMQKHCL